MPKLMKISTTQLANWGGGLLRLPQYDPRAPFVIEIDTTLGNGFNSFQIPTRSGYVYDMDVKVSDGQSFNISAWDQSETLIQFASSGIYTIEFRGYCGSWYDNNTGDILKYTYCNGFGDLEFGTCDSMFYGAVNLDFNCDDGPNMPIGTSMFRFCRDAGITFIPSKILDRVPLVTNLSFFMFHCSNLTGSAPSLDKVPLVTNLSYFMYQCVSITGSAPTLDKVPLVTNLALFMYQCLNLTGSAPSLDNVPLVTSLGFFMYQCSNLTGSAPSLDNVSLVTNLGSFMANCSNLTGSAPSLDKVPLVTTLYSFMYGCSSLTGSVPSLDNVPLVTNLGSFMANCSNLTLPADLFDLTKISIVTDWTNMLAVLNTSNSHTGTLQPIWDYASPTAIGKSTAFLNNTDLTNYAQLRIEWP